MKELYFSVEIFTEGGYRYTTINGDKVLDFVFQENWNEVIDEAVERTCRRYHAKFQAISPDSKIQVDVRMGLFDTLTTFYSYYGSEDRFVKLQ